MDLQRPQNHLDEIQKHQIDVEEQNAHWDELQIRHWMECIWFGIQNDGCELSRPLSSSRNHYHVTNRLHLVQLILSKVTNNYVFRDLLASDWADCILDQRTEAGSSMKFPQRIEVGDRRIGPHEILPFLNKIPIDYELPRAIREQLWSIIYRKAAYGLAGGERSGELIWFLYRLLPTCIKEEFFRFNHPSPARHLFVITALSSHDISKIWRPTFNPAFLDYPFYQPWDRRIQNIHQKPSKLFYSEGPFYLGKVANTFPELVKYYEAKMREFWLVCYVTLAAQLPISLSAM